MRNFTQTWQTNWTKKVSKYLPVAAAMLVFGSLGTLLLVNSHAATPTASLETENGTVSSAASNVADSSASGGHAVMFGNGSVLTCSDTTQHPSSFSNNCNTGYQAAPDYPGSLTDYSPTDNGTNCSGPITAGKTYRFCNFSSTGQALNFSAANVTFYGCRFASNKTDDANVAAYGANPTFSYDTFEPYGYYSVPASPLTHAQGYQYAIDQRNNGALHVDHADIWGFANGIQIDHSSQSAPVVVTDSWFHDNHLSDGTDHIDGILENYGDPGYDYMVFDHITIAATGNTNALALQNGNGGGYDHLTVTDSYFAGFFGYTVNIGGGAFNVTNSTFKNNVWGTDYTQHYGPLYNTFAAWNGTNLWQNNKYYVFPGTTWANTAINGRYWWPTDCWGTENGASPTTYQAHTSEYPGSGVSDCS